jgi:predicted DNA-binding transcriptional regulator YafY
MSNPPGFGGISTPGLSSLIRHLTPWSRAPDVRGFNDVSGASILLDAVNRIERLTNEILLLQERCRTSEEIAALLEISKRTVIRDMQALCEMGVPIIAQGGVGGGYSLAGDYSIAPLQLTWGEALLLTLAISSVSKLSDSPFSSERASLAAKVAALLPAKHQEKVRELLGKVEMAVPSRRKAPLLDQLVEISNTGQWVELDYDSPGGRTQATLRPDRVFTDRGFWYVEGVSDGKRRWFRADRIVDFHICPKPDWPEPLPYHHESHPLMRVQLSAQGVRAAERDPHLGGALHEIRGEHVLEMRCPPEELDWYARFFGGMGADAVVSEPPELVSKIRARAEEILKIYQ